jgi:hypothetical protein
MLSCLTATLFFFFLTANLQDRYFYHSHFMEEKTEAERG